MTENCSYNYTSGIPVFKVINILQNDFTVYGDENNPLFLAKDIAEVIDYAKTGKGRYDVSRMLGTVPETEKLIRTILVSGPNGAQRRNMWFLTENGLYTVLMQSRKPLAIQFQEEVKKILWNLRRFGIYGTSEAIQYYSDYPEEFELLTESFRRAEEERDKYKQQAQEEMNKYNQFIKDNQEKIDFCNDVLQYSDRTYSMRDICEACGITVSNKKMYDILVDKKILYRTPSGKTYFTSPFMKERYTTIVSYVVEKNGKQVVVNKRGWTESGKFFVYSIALGEKLVNRN